jgi:hypothetical protein
VSRRELWWRGEKRMCMLCVGAMRVQRVSHLLERRRVSKRYPTSTTANTSWCRDAKGGICHAVDPEHEATCTCMLSEKKKHRCLPTSHLALDHAKSTSAQSHPVLMPRGCRAHTRTTTQVL